MIAQRTVPLSGVDATDCLSLEDVFALAVGDPELTPIPPDVARHLVECGCCQARFIDALQYAKVIDQAPVPVDAELEQRIIDAFKQRFGSPGDEAKSLG